MPAPRTGEQSCADQGDYRPTMPLETVAAPADPARRTDEATTLTEFLDFYRAVLLRKADGLTPDQLTVSIAPSTLTIGKLIRHMTLVEDHWFDAEFAGQPEREPWASADWDADPDWEMTSAHGMTFAELRADFDKACERSRAHVAAAASLDALSAGGDPSDRANLRWILVHMIEEYARHVGHADLIREAIDGRLGD